MKIFGFDMKEVENTLSNFGNWYSVISKIESIKKDTNILEDDILNCPYDYSYDSGWNAAVSQCVSIIMEVFDNVDKK